MSHADNADPTPDAAPIVRSGAEERDYLSKRADDHRRLADQTSDTGSRAIHLKLQRLYEERARTTA